MPLDQVPLLPLPRMMEQQQGRESCAAVSLSVCGGCHSPGSPCVAALLTPTRVLVSARLHLSALQAAQQHPYVVKPSAGRVGSWLACGALGAVIGCCAINPDGGDYGVWLPQVGGMSMCM